MITSSKDQIYVSMTCIKQVIRYAILSAICLIGIITLYGVLNDKSYTNLKHTYFGSIFPFDEKVQIYENICIELNNQGKKIIVSYNTKKTGRQSIHVGVGMHYVDGEWIIEFRSSPMPASHKLLSIPAYFVKYTRPHNMAHLFRDVYMGLFGAVKIAHEKLDLGMDMKNTSKLYEAKSHALADTKYGGSIKRQVEWKSLNRDKFNMLQLLPAFSVVYTNVYTTIEANTCYKYGIFGQDESNVGRFEVEDAIRAYMNITKAKCKRNDKFKYNVVLQSRSQRRITNMIEVQKLLMAHFPVSVLIVDHAELSVSEQLQLDYCTDVLIGVHGAGLEHTRFMPENAGIIEIGWKGWPTTGWFEPLSIEKGIAYAAITDCNATLSDLAWEAYYNAMKRKQIFPKRDKATKREIMKKGLKMRHSDTNAWKFADCYLSKDKILSKFEIIFSKLEAKKKQTI